MTDFTWLTPSVALAFSGPQDGPVAVLSIGVLPHGAEDNRASSAFDERAAANDDQTSREQPLVELTAFGHGRFPGSFRHVDTVIGKSLRYVAHDESTDAGVHRLRIQQIDRERGLRVVSNFEVHDGVSAFRTWTEVTREHGADQGEPIILDFVSSFATGSFLADAGDVHDGHVTPADVEAFVIAHADNDWVAESRWSVESLRDAGLARIDRDVQHQPPRSRAVFANRGSWSSGEKAPTGALATRAGSLALAWQVEHNGPWLVELGENRYGAYLLLSGPTDQEHQWNVPLSAGQTFRSATASVSVAEGKVYDALRAMTDQRRSLRQRRDIDAALPVVFNDYMNTLMGNPSTEALIPLVDAAAQAGADYFCIDAGWYADGSWWDGVGGWEPSHKRFPGGLAEVTDHIRTRGMVPGLWLEPEVIGVRSQLAHSLPDDAFFSRRGVRIAEHGRHLLDLRHPSARAHVDGVVDRLVADFGIGFIKMDENTMTGPGTDRGDTSPGHGLLEHSRAVLDWLDEIQVRHPELLIENCASGAMRMDYAMLSRLHLQSTSDQQDPVMYASIAAAAAASVLPEQAGNWAYPQPGMSKEARTFALVNGILGRMYLSGYLNRMSDGERSAVREAVSAHKRVLVDIDKRHPVWPLGLPEWDAGWVALGLCAGRHIYLSLWRRWDAPGDIVIPLRDAVGTTISVESFFPAEQDAWTWKWSADAGELHVRAPTTESTARVLEIRFD
ncbi:glycoside hydrolase family 36 protein [Paramicrobacterium chengjingii]|uniref:glycoside hydrolase family 36 protein n=1 Tax=Paramicrobacterium chengjingii TaxID=2769067 RepID=UPI00141E4CE7|nr:glycoside hydrolase family 36 protein [Microbacterium chengjingii]